MLKNNEIGKIKYEIDHFKCLNINFNALNNKLDASFKEIYEER